MTTLEDKLTKLLKIEDEYECAKAFEAFCREHSEELPLPGENVLFDRVMWQASQYMTLSKGDESILNKVTTRMMAETQATAQSAVMALKDLVGSGREAAIATWQDMLAGMQWRQMVPAGATRGVGSRLMSLGTFEKQVDDTKIQLNLGWLVDKDQLRILLQAKDIDENAMADVEIRVTESDKGIVFSRKTNQDGSMVAPAVKVGPGEYQIQVLWTDKLVETPFFRI